MDLKRRKYIGIQYKVIKINCHEFKFKVTGVKKDSPANRVNLQINDMIILINDKPIRQKSLVKIIKEEKLEEIKIVFIRNFKEMSVCLQLDEVPYESSDSYEIKYDAIEFNNLKLRTIITTPEQSDRKYPVVVFIPGITHMSIEFPFSDNHPYKKIIDELTKNKNSTIRIEKTGIGDSEGEDYVKFGFDYEVSIYQTLLSNLKDFKIFDLKRVYIFGYSIGGVIAPVIANRSEINVAGIIVYGTVFAPVKKYLLDNIERNRKYYDDQIYNVELFENFLSLYLDKNMHPYNLINEVDTSYRYYFYKEKYFLGRFYTYFQELNKINLQEEWSQLYNMAILILAGKKDSLISLNEQKELYNFLLSKSKKNRKVFIELANCNHDLLECDGEYSKILLDAIVCFLSTEGKRIC